MNTNNIYLSGIKEKYPVKLLEGRVGAEGNVIGVIWSEPALLSDHDLSSTDFITKDARFFFGLAKSLRDEYHLNEFDEAAVITHLNKDSLETLESYGGYKAIRNVMDVTNIKNAQSYIDTLQKMNLYLKLYNSGFPLLEEVDNGKGKKVIPIDECRKMDYQGVSDWFDNLLARLVKDEGCNNKIIEAKTSFDITDEVVQNFVQGQMVGTSIGFIDDINVENKPIRVFPWLDSEICSLRHKTTSCLCGYSSSGKTMLMCEIILALVSHGEKFCIISNEQDSTPFFLNFISFLAFRKFRYSHLTRTKLQTGNLNDNDKKMLAKVQAYFNENFAPSIMFYQITDADITLVQRTVRRAALEFGCTGILYDTMKSDLSDYNKDQPNYLSLIRDSRTIDLLAKKYDLIALVNLQISSSTKGRTWVDESCIAQSKQLIEIMENCWMLRSPYGKAEMDENEKYYLAPFRRDKPDPNGKWVEVPYKFQPDAAYRILYITKNRAGKNSETTGECLLLRADTHIATFHEEAWCRPSRGYVGASQ